MATYRTTIERRKNKALCPVCLVRPPDGDKRDCFTCREKRAKWGRTAKHGLTLERFNSLLIDQAGRCGVCLSPLTGKSDPHIDHDHVCCPGKRSCGACVRGLLCGGCNSMLGYAKDRPEILYGAIEYLASRIPLSKR